MFVIELIAKILPDLAIDYEFSKANFTTAFDYSEESRSRSLLDLQNSVIQVSNDEKQPEIKFSSNVVEPLKLTQIQAEMPENVQLLQYTVLTDKTLIWLISKNNLIVEKTEISSEHLQEKVLDYVELVAKNTEPDEQRRLSTEFYKILISPIREKLETDKEVFFIPDKVLFRLPFITLFSDKYLIEDYCISYAPSAKVFLFCSREANKLHKKTDENLLAVGNPAFNQITFQNLQTLPSAEKEVEEIGKFYKNSKIFTEQNATKENFQKKLTNADVLHFAGHYLVDEHSPLNSSSVLAGNRKEESGLANYEIMKEKLSHIRLIVLSACQTGIEKYYNCEGMISA